MKQQDVINRVADFRAKLCAEARSDDDLVLIASQLAFQASVIYRERGGPNQAAMQFYRFADFLASELEGRS